MYTVEQVESAITAKYSAYSSEFYDCMEGRPNREYYLPALDEFAEFVKSYQPEDSGEQWLLFKVGEQYFRKYGYYNSWDSPEWDGRLVAVIPREVTVVKFIDQE
ncbi:hypothetical protein SEA_BILLNYE_184 [Streptomyces phage BillNye]|uniref:Uncharacterized protein n=2 Tax=Wilnyevirus billnye TaxID=2560486 RepID=A0A2L1IW18_9CAUD|nr:hypothetical protein FDJ30_gp077 [Streptomyces phage BillNye]AVD99356.1 hypothetical protein SEA_BILLNYE_184 [Streptomyces phage BillNye]QBZ72439.1 hypothetical protein SEA_CIRCINUS_185 [Streptomyces phage Circinus]